MIDHTDGPPVPPPLQYSTEDFSCTTIGRVLAEKRALIASIFRDDVPTITAAQFAKLKETTMTDKKICAHCDHVTQISLRSGETKYGCGRTLLAVVDGVDLVTGRTVTESQTDCYVARTTGACGPDGVYFVPGKPKPR